MKKFLPFIAALIFFLGAPSTFAASRFWVGGSGNWNTTTTHWSTTSGGASGAAAPTSADDVFIDSNSGFGAGGTISMAGTLNSAACNNFTASAGHAWTLTSVSDNIKIYGNLVFESAMTINGSLVVNMFGTGSGKTITSAGVVPDGGIIFNEAGSWSLLDNLSVGFQFVPNFGTFDANGFNVTTPKLQVTSGSAVATITLGSGTWSLTGTGQVWNSNSGTITVNGGTSTIKITDTSNTANSFISGAATYNNIWWARGASTASNTVTGNITFNDFKDDGTAAHSILFTAGQTRHVTTFTVSGTSGKLVTINSANTATHALVKDGGGIISTDFMNIQHSIATPSNTWYAGVNSTNNQAVTTAGSGWIFTAPPTPATVGHALMNLFSGKFSLLSGLLLLP